MSNPLRGEATLVAGTAAYTLVFDINALCLAEEALGMEVDELLARYSGGTSARLVRGLVWAALQAKHPCSLAEAGAIISEVGFVEAKATLEKALLLAMPVQEEGEPPKKANRGRVGTG